MADVTGITAVAPTSLTTHRLVQYGSTVVVGDLLYLDAADNKYKQAQSDSTEAVAAAAAIAVTPGSADDYGLVLTDGSITLVGATLAIGQSYVVSTNIGKIAPESDLASTNYVTRVGTGATSTQLDIVFTATGITHA